MENKVLYLNMMNNTGSTFFYNLLGTCRNAVPLRREGQSYAGFFYNEYELKCPRLFSFEREELADIQNYDVDKIRDSWISEWKRSPKWNETGKVLIQKSPSDIFRVDVLKEVFPEIKSILMVRNPYAVIEGTVRRGINLHLNQSKYSYTYHNAALHWLLCVRTQIDVIRDSDVLWFKYEDLFTDPDNIEKKIVHWFPELNDFKLNRNQIFDSQKEKMIPFSLENRNHKQINALSRSALEEINDVLIPNKEILDFFEYRLIGNG